MAASVASTEEVALATMADGPVMTMMNKRLRALRKKYNRIIQMEERVSQGKPLNKEQEELLRSKVAVSVLIDEYEHLRQPLSASIQEEISLALADATPPPPPLPANLDDENKKDSPNVTAVAAVEDLLRLLYFGHLFDVKSQNEYETTMLMRTHERGCCITYDTVTDETTSLLEERDLDMISALGCLVLSRPPNSSISHKGALMDCLEHAKLWLQNSDQPIQTGSSYTYAGLREYLNKILASDYAIATPEVKPSVDLAAEVGIYSTSQPHMSDLTVSSADVKSDCSPDHYQHEANDSETYQEKGDVLDQSNPADESVQNYSDPMSSGDVRFAQQELDKLQFDEEDQSQRDGEPGEPQYASRRTFQNHRGVNRGGGARRGYFGGRGGRGVPRGGGYQNGRGQYYDTGYHPRSYYNTRGRGGRGAGYNNYGTAGGRAPDVELGAS